MIIWRHAFKTGLHVCRRIPQALKWPFIELRSMNCHRISFFFFGGGECTISSKFLLQQEMIHIVDHFHWNDCTKLARPFFSFTLSYTFGLVWFGECDIVLGGNCFDQFAADVDDNSSKSLVIWHITNWLLNSVWRWLFRPICFLLWWPFIRIWWPFIKMSYYLIEK